MTIRRRAHATLAAWLFVAVGCELRPADSADEGEPPALQAGTARLLVAWRADASPDVDSAESMLLRDDGDGYLAIGRAMGVVVLVDGKLLWVERREIARNEAACTCAPEAGFMATTPARCVVARAERVPVFADGQGGVRHVFGPPGQPDPSPSGEVQTTYTLDASFGALMLWTACTFTSPCGAAHGSHRCRQHVWDARAERATHVFTDAEYTRINRAPRAMARLRLSHLTDLFEAAAAVEYAGVRVRLGSGAALKSAAAFTSDASYADSSDWAAYKRVVEVPIGWLPAALRRHRQLPSAVKRAWSVLPRRFGWSTTTVSAAAADEIAARFHR